MGGEYRTDFAWGPHRFGWGVPHRFGAEHGFGHDMGTGTKFVFQFGTLAKAGGDASKLKKG